MATVLGREFVYLWYYFDLQLRQIFGYWAVGILVGSIVSVFFKQSIERLMESLLMKRLGLWGILPAAAIGILSPLCLYGSIPIAASFARSKMREDWIAAFMVSSVLLNPQLFFYSLALGRELAFLRLAVSFLGGCCAGVLVRCCFSNGSFFTMRELSRPPNRDTDPNPLLRLLRSMGRNVKITLPYFLAGVLLTALYQRYVPTHWVVGLFGREQGFGTLMAAALGVPLYACGGGTIALIAAWLGQGMSNGSAISFMIAGAATKLTNLGAVKIVLGTRSFVLYLLFVLCFASLSGFLVNVLLG